MTVTWDPSLWRSAALLLSRQALSTKGFSSAAFGWSARYSDAELWIAAPVASSCFDSLDTAVHQRHA